MAKDTHRFEAGYLDYLIGPLEENKETYHARSPIYNVELIKTPVIFFHGLQDKVVNVEQVKKIYNQLQNKKIPSDINIFNNEGHGFKDGQINIEVLKLTEKFFNLHLGL